MVISFDDINLPIEGTVPPEGEDDDVTDIEDDAASHAGSVMSISEYGGSITELPPWCLFAVKECRCIFELDADKSVFYRVCGNVLGACKCPGHATGEKAAVGYYEPVKARKYVDRRLNTFLSVEDFAGKEKGRIEAKTKEMAMASARFGRPKDSPTGSEEALYFQARPVDTRLFAPRPGDATMAADAPEPRKLEPKTEAKKEFKPSLKPPHKYSKNPNARATTPIALNTDLGFEGGPGLVQRPTLKKLQATGFTAESMDPATVMMMAMVDQLTTSMATLAMKVEGISTAPKSTTEDVKPKLGAPATKGPKVENGAPLTHPEPKAKHYYGIGHGLDGTFGVFTSWGELALWLWVCPRRSFNVLILGKRLTNLCPRPRRRKSNVRTICPPVPRTPTYGMLSRTPRPDTMKFSRAGRPHRFM
jgi:hypothetical protein